jgi:anti-sigma regulatory factor (Ser/Thr protein kinase)
MSAPSRPAPAINERRQALLIDSSPELNRMLNDLCDQHDWDIVAARDNQEALELSKSHPFDLIITGERTSSQQDIELLRRLRLVRPHTRLIILTDEFTPGDVLNSIRERAFSYFARPFSTEELAGVVRLAMTTPFWDDGIDILSATPDWVRLAVRCDLATADRLIQFYREASDLPENETEQVATAFREILLNAIEHGGKFDASQHVEVSYLRARRAVLCKVRDPGTGFSLEELKHSALTNPPDEPFRHIAEREAQGIRPGGYGILMAKELVDDLLYNQQGNEVLLIKYLNKSDP